MVKFKEIRHGVILISELLPDGKSEDHFIIVDNFGETHVFKVEKIN
jgi:hypothetical protein